MMTFYELRTMNKMNEYSIKENARKMLQAHDDWKSHKIDEAELGRLIRLSPGNRAAVIQTMVKTAGIMQKKPEESKFVLAIIEMCGEIVSIADKPPPSTGFPSFLKLPHEIRYRIYHFYLKPRHSLSLSNIAMIPFKKKGSCYCAPPDHPPSAWKRNISLALTSKRMRDEFLPYFYRTNTISFVCACEMGVHLRNSAFIREHIRKIKFHWCGREADKGIVELENCSIESLTVVISQTTMKEPSRREAELSNHFTRFSNKRGFPEALGFEELSALRGLQEIDVELASKRRTKDGCSSTERSSLKAWLERLKQPSKG